MDYGANIKAARKAAGLTQKQLADRLGISFVNISQLENNQRTPSLVTLQRLADALGLHIFDLIGIGKRIEQIEFETEGIENLDGSPMTPERIAEVKEFLSKNPREIYSNASDKVKKIFWNTLVEDGALSELRLLSNRERIYAALEQMNEEGQRRVADYAEDILPRYRTETTPQPPPRDETPGRGTDTTPPPEGTEETQKGADRGGDEISTPF